MDEPEEKQTEAHEELRCDPKQLELLKKCSEKKDMTEWNHWRMVNPKVEIWLQEAPLKYAYLEGAEMDGAHLEQADLADAHLKRAEFDRAHLERAEIGDAHLEEAILIEAHLEDAKLLYVHLEEARLVHSYLQRADLMYAHLEGAELDRAHLEEARLEYSHLEGANFEGVHLEGADFRASVVDGSTLFWECSVDRKTDFRGVGLDSCRIDEQTKYLLQYNRRRMNCEDWYKQHPRLAWPVKAFFWVSDYGNSTWRIIKSFFFMAICFAIIYYVWGAVDYYILGVTDSVGAGLGWHPGIVANLFIDQGRPVLSWLVPLRSIYFSIVTMTTLGFGDMYANTNNYWLAAACGHLLLMLQVLLGYVMLGTLVTRIGILFTSGLIPSTLKKKQQNRSK